MWSTNVCLDAGTPLSVSQLGYARASQGMLIWRTTCSEAVR
jgi:hypothetical protein